MIVRTPERQGVEVRMFEGTDQIPQPGTVGSLSVGGGWSNAGRMVSADSAVGLPAALAAVRLLAETTGELPCIVRREGDIPVRVPESNQWRLLHSEPNRDQTPFDFFAYLIASLQQSNAYILKLKSRVGVEELVPLSPDDVFPFYREGQMRYRVYRNGETTTVTRADLIHIPGILWDHPYIGISPIAAHRNSLGAALAAEEFGGRFFTNGGAAGGVIEVPEPMNDKAAKQELMESWNARHSGVGNAHRTGLLTNGAKYQPLGVNMQDAAYVESQRFSVQQIARIFRVPSSLIGDDNGQRPSNTHPEVANQQFLQFSLQPWLTRIEQALWKDRDLFPDPTLRPSFVVEAILRADITSRFQAYLWARQAGWMTANEIRAKEDMPPDEDGDELQATPVGGAPNTDPTGADTTGVDKTAPPSEPDHV